MPVRRLVLVVALLSLGWLGMACGQGGGSTTGGRTAVTTPAGTLLAVASPSPPTVVTTPVVTTTPICAPTTPSAVTGSAAPSPDAAGQYSGLTFGQAQQLASFHLAQPAWLPPCLSVSGITASIPNLTEVQPNPPLAGSMPTPSVPATPVTGPVRVVRVSFSLPNSTMDASGTFTVVINELKQGIPLGLVEGQDTPDSTTTRLMIAGHSVTRKSWAVTAVYPQSGPNAVYVWTNQGTAFQFAVSIMDWPVTELNVEHMIASMLH